MTTPELLEKASARGWRVDACPDAQLRFTIRVSDGTEHGDTEAQPIATVYREADAVLIVAAVNSFEALRASLLELLPIHQRQFDSLPEAPTSDAWQAARHRLERAYKALALADGGRPGGGD